MFTLLPANKRTPQPWKNGGGLTRDIIAYPPGSHMDTFDWRISMAEVTEPGPFSYFPDIERTLALLEGALTLVFAKGVEPKNYPPWQVFVFLTATPV